MDVVPFSRCACEAMDVADPLAHARSRLRLSDEARLQDRGGDPVIGHEGCPVAVFARADQVAKAARVALAAAPSSLMLGSITHMSTDIAAIPLLWVIPLSLYLLTFVLAFARFSRGPYDAPPARAEAWAGTGDCLACWMARSRISCLMPKEA